MKYYRICKGIADKGVMIPEEEVSTFIQDFDREWYVSVFYYNNDQYNDFKTKGSVAGFTGLKTNKLFFDFDDKDNIENARSDCLELVNKLLKTGLTQDQFNICFSSNKGFSVELYLIDDYSAKQIKGIAKGLAGNLKSWDSVVYNENRIFRFPYTKNKKSGLHKIPLSLSMLAELPIEEIKNLAKDLDNGIEYSFQKIELPRELELEDEITEDRDEPTLAVDFERRIKWLPACKEAILQGFFKPGKRNNALMALAAGLKAQGIPKETNYRMLKSAAEAQASRHNQEPYPKEEIWKNIVEVVYGPNWKGATYACREHDWLEDICKITGPHQCKLKEAGDVISFEQLAGKFRDFAKNIEKNRIRTGIEELDKKIMLTTSMPIGLLGAPGSGKTTISFDILSNTSKAGVRSMFFSMDMGWPLVYAKMVSRVSGIDFEQVLETYKSDSNAYEEYDKLIIEEFPKVDLSFKSGLTVDDIRNIIVRQNELTPENKIKLVVLDYLELISGPFSDTVANTAHISAKLKDLATDLELCVLVLLQPPKSSGDASSPLTSMRQIKGSSSLEQNLRVIFGIYREGFSPNTPENDKFMTINCLKNSLGPLFSVDLHWEGLRGKVRALTANEAKQLDYLRHEKDESSKDQDDGW